jgi:hypothetical protein
LSAGIKEEKIFVILFSYSLSTKIMQKFELGISSKILASFTLPQKVVDYLDHLLLGLDYHNYPPSGH